MTRVQGTKRGWSNEQKGLAVQACASVCVDRHFVLLQLGGHAKVKGGKTSSTSPDLTNADFEKFMAIVESYCANEQLIIGRKVYQPGQWMDSYENGGHRRLHYVARDLVRDTGDAPYAWGVIEKAIGRREATLFSYDTTELRKIIDALRQVMKRSKTA